MPCQHRRPRPPTHPPTHARGSQEPDAAPAAVQALVDLVNDNPAYLPCGFAYGHLVRLPRPEAMGWSAVGSAMFGMRRSW